MQPTQGRDITREEEVLAVSLELAKKRWKVGLDDGKRNEPTVHGAERESPEARLSEVIALIENTKRKWALSPGVRVVIVYEAGQDGFWIQRALTRHGYDTLMVDPASIPVERRSRRAKTDRLDAIRLVQALRAWLRGEHGRMKVVRAPTLEAEGQRHLSRERGTVQKEVEQHRDRLRKLLCTMGYWGSIEGDLAGRLERGEITGHGGCPLPGELRERLIRECQRLKLAQEQLAYLEKHAPQQLPEPVRQHMEQLTQLKAIGPVSAQRLMLELFWRQFNNRRQVGACVGLPPQPYDSGESRVDQGISKAGNRRVRALLIEMAWMWLRWQPQSELARWFAKRTSGAGTNKRVRRIAIVAVARRLAILLWRYLRDGVLPEGVKLKPVKVKLAAA